MRTLAQISDLHFGREDQKVVDGLQTALEQAAMDVLVVSGDLTQRAKKRQFKAARDFLASLVEVPLIVVPGNHDISTTNLMERALQPLARYKRYITTDLAPSYVDNGVAIAGINTVRVLSTKDGRINLAQVRQACEQLQHGGEGAVRVVVTHHPMDMPLADTRHALVTRAPMAMREFATCGVDLFLSGHLHAGLTVATSMRYKLRGYSAVAVHAGTAVSTRTRDEANSWNLIHVDRREIAVQQMIWNGKRFVQGERETFERSAETDTGEDLGWVRSGR